MNKVASVYKGWISSTYFFVFALILGNTLLLTLEGSTPRLVGALVILFLPGLAWVDALALVADPLVRYTIGLGLSYALLIILGLLLHYLAGGISIWMVVLPLNLVTLTAVVRKSITGKRKPEMLERIRISRSSWVLLMIILLYGTLFRFANLGYSEIQRDEVDALAPAAEAIEGRSNALFYLRNKGPGEILVPMMVWRLTGLIDETSARMLFAVAGVMAILTTYLVGEKMFGTWTGLTAAGLVGLNGFMVAFSRIVQYQIIVVWMSLLSLLCVWLWRQDTRERWWLITAVFLGTGLLAHYDTILIAPAILYLFLLEFRLNRSSLKGIITGGIVLIIIMSLFFVPFLLSPRVSQAGEYLSERIGLALLKNGLSDFFFYHIFYNSFFYVIIVGGLALGILIWASSNIKAVQQMGWGRLVLAVASIIIIVCVSVYPTILTFSGIDLAFLPFTLIFLGAFFSPVVNLAHRTVIVWLATAFLGYNFLVGNPRTHFYAITLPWILLAGVSVVWIWRSLARRLNSYVPVVFSLLLIALCSGYLYALYLRQNPEYETDWPESRLLLYWSPYDQLPRYDDLFGMVNKIGWKTVGGLYAGDQIEGDYQTNGLYEVANWYTRFQLRGCYDHSTQFFGVSYRLIDPRDMPVYKNVGTIDLPNDKGMTIYQAGTETRTNLGNVDVDYWNNAFDSTARPAAFLRPVTNRYALDVNLADAIQLVGYDMTVSQPRPGEQIAVNLHWKAQRHIPFNLDVFVHLESDEDGSNHIWGQSNGSPSCGKNPTSKWDIDSLVTDLHILNIDPATPAGTYKIVTGMYLPEENRRVPILDEAGSPVADTITLSTITIESN